MTILGRELSQDERESLERLAHSRKAEARLVDRAKLILAAADGRRKMEVCRAIGKDKHTVDLWIGRFLERGIEGLCDLARSGAPCRYTEEEKAEVLQAALTPPQQLGLPFGRWTHDRLAAYINEQKTRIAEILRAEGLRWHHEETWYGERVDPAFAEKRGPSSARTKLLAKRR